MNKIFVVGGANIDLFAQCRDRLIIKDSNPSAINMSFGGVGHNIACNICRYGEKVYFVSRFADDMFGKMVYDACLNDGLNLDYSLKTNNYPTSMYLAIMDEHKDMYLASSDMRIVEDLRYEDLMYLKDVIEDDDYLVIDTNLNEDVITKICREFKGIKVCDAISANKVHKIANNLPYIDILKVNMIEAETLIGRKLDSDEKIVAALRALRAKGAKEVLITTKNGAYLASDKIYYFEHDAYNKDIQNTTGAGDAFLGAYVYMHKKDVSIAKRVCFALSAAVLTVQSKETVVGLNHEVVENFLYQCHFRGGNLYVF